MIETDFAELVPNLILPGFPKCGTTSVAETLAGHPDVATARPHRATHFFTPRLYDHDATLGPITDYRANFRHAADSKIRVDDTVIWIYGGKSMARLINEYLVRPKILIMMREPASRTASYLTWKKRNVAIDQNLSLEEYVDQCERLGPRTVDTAELNAWSGLFGSEYERFLPEWIDQFGSNIRFGFTDDLKLRPTSFYQAVASWLEIDPLFFNDDQIVVANQAASVRSITLERGIRFAGKRAQGLAQRTPGLYKTLRNMARATNIRPEITPPADPTVENLKLRFNSGKPDLLKLTAGRTLLGPPGWMH